MSTTFYAYAASEPHAALEPFSFDPDELGPEEAEIQVSHCGICHSDLSMLDNEWGISAFPFVPGHEAVGTVVALGEEAKDLKIGQRVGVGWFAHSCLSCYECLSGDHHLCARGQGTMVGRYGGFADRLRVQWTWARPLPDTLDLAKAGPLFCGGITVFSPLLLHNLSSTARVGIIGIGGLGHMALQFANKWGCEVHIGRQAFPLGRRRIELHQHFGACEDCPQGIPEVMNDRSRKPTHAGDALLPALRARRQGNRPSRPVSIQVHLNRRRIKHLCRAL